MYSHYVVLIDWATEDDADVQVLGIAHTYDDAKIILNKYVEEERGLAAENGYEVIEDNEWVFEAGIMGYWRDNHIALYIQGANQYEDL